MIQVFIRIYHILSPKSWRRKNKLKYKLKIIDETTCPRWLENLLDKLDHKTIDGIKVFSYDDFPILAHIILEKNRIRKALSEYSR